MRRRRRRIRRPLVVGLTGGIGTGKSTASRVFRAARVPVFDADREVHRVGRLGGAAVAPIGRLLPDAVRGGAVDRARLRAALAADPALLGAIERVVHPLVRAARDRFLGAARRARLPIVVLDVPLLFETGGDALCDLTVVVSAPPSIQRARVRRRRAMSEADAERLIARQMPDRDKRRRADVVVPTGLSRGDSARRLRRLLRVLRSGSLHERVITIGPSGGAVSGRRRPGRLPTRSSSVDEGRSR